MDLADAINAEQLKTGKCKLTYLAVGEVFRRDAQDCDRARNSLEMVEAVGVEPTSETTDNREHSCFSRVHLCLVSGT